MLNANLNRYVFNLFLKTLVSETVRSSEGREFYDGEEKSPLSELGAQPRCGVVLGEATGKPSLLKRSV